MSEKKIVLQKKINNELVDIMPKTLAELVYVPGENGTSQKLTQTIADINSSIGATDDKAELCIKHVEYNNGAIEFYVENSTEVASGSVDPAFIINVPEEQFLDAAQTRFIPNYNYTGVEFTQYVGKAGFSEALNGKALLVLAVKTIASNGSNSIVYTPIDLSAMVDTYTGSAHTNSNPIGITVNSNGQITGSIAIQANDNALKINSNGELYVEDLAIEDGTEGGIVVQDAQGKMADSGVVLKGSNESLTRFTSNTIVGALNELNQPVSFGADGQIKLEEDKTIGQNTYDYYMSIDHIDADKVEIDANEGDILVANDSYGVTSSYNINDILKRNDDITDFGVTFTDADGYSKNVIDVLQNVYSKDDVYTKDEMDSQLSGKVDYTDYANLENEVYENGTRLDAVENNIDNINDSLAEKVDASDVYTQSEVDEKISEAVYDNNFMLLTIDGDDEQNYHSWKISHPTLSGAHNDILNGYENPEFSGKIEINYFPNNYGNIILNGTYFDKEEIIGGMKTGFRILNVIFQNKEHRLISVSYRYELRADSYAYTYEDIEVRELDFINPDETAAPKAYLEFYYDPELETEVGLSGVMVGGNGPKDQYDYPIILRDSISNLELRENYPQWVKINLMCPYIYQNRIYYMPVEPEQYIDATFTYSPEIWDMGYSHGNQGIFDFYSKTLDKHFHIVYNIYDENNSNLNPYEVEEWKYNQNESDLGYNSQWTAMSINAINNRIFSRNYEYDEPYEMGEKTVIGEIESLSTKANNIESRVDALEAGTYDDTELVNRITAVEGDVDDLDARVTDLEEEVSLHSDNESITIEADSTGYNFEVNLEDLANYTADSLVGALNEVKAEADLIAAASATQGGTFFVAKNGTTPNIGAYDLIIQEID